MFRKARFAWIRWRVSKQEQIISVIGSRLDFYEGLVAPARRIP